MRGMGLKMVPVLVRHLLDPPGLSGLIELALLALKDTLNGPSRSYNPPTAAYPPPPTPYVCHSCNSSCEKLSKNSAVFYLPYSKKLW